MRTHDRDDELAKIGRVEGVTTGEQLVQNAAQRPARAKAHATTKEQREKEVRSSVTECLAMAPASWLAMPVVCAPSALVRSPHIRLERVWPALAHLGRERVRRSDAGVSQRIHRVQHARDAEIADAQHFDSVGRMRRRRLHL